MKQDWWKGFYETIEKKFVVLIAIMVLAVGILIFALLTNNFNAPK